MENVIYVAYHRRNGVIAGVGRFALEAIEAARMNWCLSASDIENHIVIRRQELPEMPIQAEVRLASWPGGVRSLIEVEDYAEAA